jgi:integrase
MKKGFDIHNFNHRMENALAGLRENQKVSLHNRLKILEFLDYLETQGIGLPRRIRYVLQVGKFAAMLPMDFEKATRKDIEALLLKYGRLELEDETKSAFKIMLKRFYRWLKDPEDQQYPPEVSWIKTSVKNSRRILPEEILNEKEVEALIRAAESPRDKAFVSMLFDLGSRPGEFLSLQRKNIAFDKLGGFVLVEGKMGQRRQRLIISVPFLAKWLEEHPDKNPEASLWVHERQGCHEDGIVSLDYYSARKLLQRLKKKTGIQKPVNPYSFRHARATFLANSLTEAQLRQVFGWTQASKMPGRYVHLSGRDVDTALLRVHGLLNGVEEEKSKLSVVKCVRCEQQNSTIQRLCTRCGMPLDLKAALESEDMKEKEMQSMRDQMKQIQMNQSRTNAMLMDLIELNSQGRNLKWIPPPEPRVDGLLATHVKAEPR